MSKTGTLPEDFTAKAVSLLLRVYMEGEEETDPNTGEDLEGIIIPDALYDEICALVEGAARELGVTNEQRKDHVT